MCHWVQGCLSILFITSCQRKASNLGTCCLHDTDAQITDLPLQVCSRQQIALMFIHMYPYIPSVETTVNTLATLRGGADKHTIFLSALSEPMTVEWVQFEKYLQEVVLQDPFGYAPVPRAKAHSVEGKQADCSVSRPLRRAQKASKVSHSVLY